LDGVIEDEAGDVVPLGYTGKGNVGKFDGSTYSVGGTGAVHDGTYLKVNAIFNNISNGFLVSKYGSSGNNREFSIKVENASDYTVYISPFGSLTDNSVLSFNGFSANNTTKFVNLEFIFNNGACSLMVDGENKTATATKDFINNGTQALQVGAHDSGSEIEALITYIIIEDVNANKKVEYHFNNQWGNKIYDSSGNNNHATLVGHTLVDFWGETEHNLPSTYVDNIKNIGYSLYRHNTDSVTNKDILVPLVSGTNVEIVDTIPNYTKVGETIRGKFKWNAQLVEATCGTFDGVCYAELGNSIEVNPGESLEITINLTDHVYDDYFLGGVSNSSGLKYTGTELRVYISPNEGTVSYIATDKFVKLKLENIDNQNYNMFIDDVLIGIADTVNSTPFNVLKIGGRTTKNWKGALFDFKTFDASNMLTTHLPIAEGSGTILHDSGINKSHATLVNYTLPDFWEDNTQDVIHSNYVNGFSFRNKVINSSALSNEVSEWSFYIDGKDGQQPVVIFYFMSDDTSGTNSYFLEPYKYTTYLKKVVGGVVTTITSHPTNFDIKHNYTITRATNGNIIVFDNGVEVINITDTTFTTSNYVVLRTYLDPLYYTSLTAGGNELFDFPRVPADTQNPTKDVLGYPLTNPPKIGLNDCESKIQLPNEMIKYQSDNLITSLTGNKNLVWENGVVKGFNISTSGTSTVTEVWGGTRIYSPDGDSCILVASPSILDASKTYNYYIKINSNHLGVKLEGNGFSVPFLNAGAFYGNFMATGSSMYISRRTAGSDAVVSQFVVWEKGTIPPLSYSEMRLNSNNNHQVYSYAIDKDHRSLLLYDTPLTPRVDLKVAKCMDKAKVINILKDPSGTPLCDLDGYVLVDKVD